MILHEHKSCYIVSPTLRSRGRVKLGPGENLAKNLASVLVHIAQEDWTKLECWLRIIRAGYTDMLSKIRYVSTKGLTVKRREEERLVLD